MVQHLKKLLTTLSWTTDDLIDFNGRYLSEPKAQVYFEGQIDPVSLAKFKKESIKQGLKCDAKTRLLYRSPYFWCNGERFTLTERLQPVMESLADTREALPHDPWTALMPGDWNTLYELYMLGWIHLRL
jgi:50S ribosomal protein L16 3-hydroxylase